MSTPIKEHGHDAGARDRYKSSSPTASYTEIRGKSRNCLDWRMRTNTGCRRCTYHGNATTSIAAGDELDD